MEQIPDEYRGNRCVAVLLRPVGSLWDYYIRIGDSIQDMERVMKERRNRYAFSYITLPPNRIPEEKDKFIAKFEHVNVSFLDLVIRKVAQINQIKSARSNPLDSVSLDEILAMSKKKDTAKSKKDDSTVLGI